jgi:hypothetical protein
VLSLSLGAAPAFGGAGADKIALDMASPPSTASIKRPVLLLAAHGSARERNCALASTMRLTMANRSRVLARQPVYPRHRHHVAGAEFAEHPVKLAPVGPRARHLLTVDVPVRASGLAKLLKLTVEGLPVGRDARIAD